MRTCFGGRVVCSKLKLTVADDEQLDADRPEPSEIEAFGNYFAEAFVRLIIVCSSFIRRKVTNKGFHTRANLLFTVSWNEPNPQNQHQFHNFVKYNNVQ